MKWMLMPYRRYFDFSGRSRRMEYWMFVLLFAIVYAGAMMLLFWDASSMSKASGSAAAAAELGGVGRVGAYIFGFYFLVSFIPLLSVQVRRFHDQDKSGWFSLLGFVPVVGALIVFLFMCFDGTPGPNRFGPDPNDRVGAQSLY